MKSKILTITLMIFTCSFFSCGKDDPIDSFTVKDAKIFGQYTLKTSSVVPIPNTTKADVVFDVTSITKELGTLKASINVVFDFSNSVSEPATAFYTNELGEKIATNWKSTFNNTDKKLSIEDIIFSGTGKFQKIKGQVNFTIDFDNFTNGSGTMGWIVSY